MPVHIPWSVLLSVVLVFFNASAAGELACPVSQTGYCPGELIRCTCTIARSNVSIAWVVNGDMYTLDHEDIGNGNRITVISHTDAAVISQLDVRMNNSDISVACGGGQATLRLAGVPPTVQVTHAVCNDILTIDLAYLISPIATWFVVQLLPPGASSCSDHHCQNQTINVTRQVQFIIDTSARYTLRVTPINCVGRGNTTEKMINNGSLVLAEASSNSTQACVQYFNNDRCNSVLTYTDATTKNNVSRTLIKEHGTVCLNSSGKCGVWSLNGQRTLQTYKALDSLSIEANSSDCLLQITFETNACVREEWMSLSINKTLLSNSRFTWSTTGVVVNLTNLTNLYVLGRNVAVLLEFKPPNGETHPISLRLNRTFCDSTSSSISTSSSLNSSLLLMVAAVAVIFTFV